MICLKHSVRKKISVLVGIFLMIQSVSLIAQNDCPDIQINFNIPSVVCADPGNSMVDLEVDITGGNGTGAGQWSGTHITNTTNGFFRTTFATPGPQKVYYTYTEGMCTYQDSTTFLYARPTIPTFLASSEQAGHLCQDSFSILKVISSYDPATTNLIWDFAGGTAEEQGSPDSLHVFWDTPGSKLIKLQSEQYGCLSQPIIQQVVLDPVIDTPVVACDNTLESVVYQWEDPPNSSATIVFVISGPNGIADTTEDKYTIENLMPGQIVQVRMVTTSENTCDGNFIDPICQSTSCDGNLIDIQPIEKVCISSGTTDTLDLDYILYDTLTPGTLTWSGTGVFDPDQARIAVDPSMAGQTQWVYVQFQSASCTVTDSVSFELIPPPVADFSLPTTSCQEEITKAEFAFGPIPSGSDTTLLWNFGDAVVAGDPEGGQADLSWASTGLKTVSLALQVGACISDTVYRFVNVQAAPEAAQINCTPGPNSVVFSWQTVAGATFDVRVLEGPQGTRISTTSYQITDLEANQNVAIEVTTNGAGTCNIRTSTASCLPVFCPSVSIVIDALPPFCLSSNPVPINLEATVNGGDGTGTLTWSGPKVSGSSWLPDNTLAGQTVVLYAEYQEGVCKYTDSIEVNIPELISVDFMIDAAICLQNTSTLEATGSFPANADFAWQLNGVTLPTLNGPGPHTLSWDNPGNQELSLTVTDGQCASATVSKFIQVLAPLPDPVVTCTSGIEEVIFSWLPLGAIRQEVIYTGPGTGTPTSDTSFLISGLAPETAVTIEIQFIDDNFPCRNASAQVECSTGACDNLSVDWSAPAAICQAEPFVLSFATQGAGSQGFDLAIRQGNQITTHSGITNGSTLVFDLNAGTTFALISAGLPGNTSCSVTLPDPLNIRIDTPVEAGSQAEFPAICEGTNTNISLIDLLNNSPSNGQWSFVSGATAPATGFDPLSGTLDPSLLSAGRYTFQYRVGINGSCPADSVLLELNILEAPLADAGPDQNLDCQFNIASLGSNQTSAGKSYQWEGPSAGAITDPSAPITEVTLEGIYTLTVTDPFNSCSAVDEVTVTASPDMITPYARVIPISCYGDSDGMIIIDSIAGGREPYTFSLNGRDLGTQSIIPNLAAGSYDLKISSGDGCEATALLTMDTPVELSVQLASDIERGENAVSAGDSVRLTALVNIPVNQIAAISWLPDTGNDPDLSLTRMVRPLITSSYGIEITDLNGCTVSDRISILVNKLHNAFIPNAFSPNEDGHNDVFYVQTDQTVRQIKYFGVYDRWGKQLFVNQNFQPNDPAEGWDGNTRGLAQSSAVYVYQVELELASGESLILSGDVALLR